MKIKNDSPHKPIALHVVHHSNIHVISAHLQDAIIPASSLYHQNDLKTFKMLGNRFCWEKFLNPDDPIKIRVHAGIHFDHVLHVQKHNLHLHHPNRLYNMMAMQATENEVLIHFSENATIRLQVEKISCKMTDLHEPYPTQFLPVHNTHE